MDELLRPVPKHLQLVKETPDFGSTEMGGQVGANLNGDFSFESLKPEEVETLGEKPVLNGYHETTPEQRDIFALTQLAEENREEIEETKNSLMEASIATGELRTAVWAAIGDQEIRLSQMEKRVETLLNRRAEWVQNAFDQIRNLRSDIDRLNHAVPALRDHVDNTLNELAAEPRYSAEVRASGMPPEKLNEINKAFTNEPTRTAVGDEDAAFLRFLAKRFKGESMVESALLRIADDIEALA